MRVCVKNKLYGRESYAYSTSSLTAFLPSKNRLVSKEENCHRHVVQHYRAHIGSAFMCHSFCVLRRDWNAASSLQLSKCSGLIAAMILLLCINSLIVVTKSICYDTWGVVKLFNVYYKNSLRVSPHFRHSCLSAGRVYGGLASRTLTRFRPTSPRTRFADGKVNVLYRFYVINMIRERILSTRSKRNNKRWSCLSFFGHLIYETVFRFDRRNDSLFDVYVYPFLDL